MELVRDQFEAIWRRFSVAIRNGELQVRPEDGFYCFTNVRLPDEMDAMRHVVVSLLNPVLEQAGVRPIRGPSV
jgi:hypothetical protein